MPDQTALWVNKFVLPSDQNRYEQNPGKTGKLTDYSVTDILHNQCTVQLREQNFWNFGPYNWGGRSLHSQTPKVTEHCSGRSHFKQFHSVQYCFNMA